MKASRGKAAMGGGSKGKHKGGKHPHKIHVRRGKSGGFIAEHHFPPGEDGQMQEPEEHVLPDMQSLQAHMADNMGDQGASQPPSAPPAAGASAAPPPQMGA